MSVKPIGTAEDHRPALKEIETLMMAGMNTPDGDRLDPLATIVEAYEAEHFPIESIAAKGSTSRRKL